MYLHVRFNDSSQIGEAVRVAYIGRERVQSVARDHSKGVNEGGYSERGGGAGSSGMNCSTKLWAMAR